MTYEHTQCLILGGGPAGYTAAIYAGRANLHTVLYEGLQPGGQLTTTTQIDNFPGFPNGIDGTALMNDFRTQAAKFGTELRYGTATAVNLSHRPYEITIDETHTLTADTLIIATGASANFLGLPEEQQYIGIGVSACATCDGFFYRNKVVAVVGGGDTACEEANYLAGLAKSVYMVVRKDHLRASQIMQTKINANPKITTLFNHHVVGIYGAQGVEGIHLLKQNGTEIATTYDLAVDGLFLAIGHKPNSNIFKPYLQTDERGYIITKGATPCTALPGVFAAGDVADPHYQQAITAAASGCQAAIEAERYIRNGIN